MANAKLQPQNVSETQKQRAYTQRAALLSACLPCESAASVGLMETELLQCFVRCSNSSHKACVTIGCTMLQPVLCSHDITAARHCWSDVFHPQVSDINAAEEIRLHNYRNTVIQDSNNVSSSVIIHLSQDASTPGKATSHASMTTTYPLTSSKCD